MSGDSVDIVKDGSPHPPIYGHQTVGLAAKKLTLLGVGKLTRGVCIRAPGPNDADTGIAGDPNAPRGYRGNRGIVFIGGIAVTANNAEGTGGMPIPPGESITIPCLDPSSLYVVGNVNNIVDGQPGYDDDVAWIGI